MPQNNQNSSQTPQQTQPEAEKLSALDSGLASLMRIKDFLLDSWQKLNNLEQTNFQLALSFMSQGAYRDAALRLRIVLWLNPKNPYAHYLLGKAYIYAGKREKAIAPLEAALKAKPELEEAIFFLSACGIGAVPERVPPSLVIEQLEAIAPIYDEQIASNINIPIYQLGTNLLLEHLQGKQGFEVLDLDIRTGKIGEFIAPFANHIVGVEPCMQLISQARNRRVNERLLYNELITRTSLDHLRKEERKFDIIHSYFSSNAYGNLNEFFELAVARMRPQSLFLLVVEGCAGEGYIFNTSKMSFQHSAPYIEKIAKKNELELVSNDRINYDGGAFDLVFLLKNRD